jgi:hypothetical protein
MSIERALFNMSVNFSEAITSTLGGSQPTASISVGADLTDDTEIFCAHRVTLADGANTTLNLHDGSLTDDVSGRACAFDSVKGILIRNNFALGEVLVGAAAATPMDGLVETEASHRLTIDAGGAKMQMFGTAIDVSTNVNLKLTHDGTGSAGGTVDIFLCGEGTAT